MGLEKRHAQEDAAAEPSEQKDTTKSRALQLRLLSVANRQEDNSALEVATSRVTSATGTNNRTASDPVIGLPRGGEPTDAQLRLLEHHSQALESAHPREVIAWAVEHFFPKLTMATAFGPEGCVILHFLAQVEPRVCVFNLDTGYQFQETLELRDRIAERYGIEVQFERPELSVEEYEKQNGGPVYRHDPTRCCLQRKVKVLQRAASGYHAWMSGIRRDQSPHRQNAPIIGWDKKFQLAKISPLANWTKENVWKLILDEKIPYNPLHDQGYPSIGCQPCTQAVVPGEDERAGRWSGSAKTECGLHLQD